MQDLKYAYQFRVSFYDTDAMGVMHHAAYLKKFEDARVAWLRDIGLNQSHYPKVDMVLAVISAELNYTKPCFYEQLLTLQLKINKKRLKLIIDYETLNADSELIATGRTVHVPLNKELKLCAYPEAMLNFFDKGNLKNG